MSEESALLTVREVAKVLRVSTMTIYHIVHSGELPCVRVSRSMRIPRVDVQAFATTTGHPGDGDCRYCSAVTAHDALARNMRRSPGLARLIVHQHVRDGQGNCAGCAEFTSIRYPCPLAKLALESLDLRSCSAPASVRSAATEYDRAAAQSTCSSRAPGSVNK